MDEDRKVCNGCWKRGVCDRPKECRCPCDGGVTWQHTDDKRVRA